MSTMTNTQKNSDTLNSTTSNSNNEIRTSLNGVWILDKKRGQPSVRGFLETMGVNELAIEANEKGEADHDTIHDICLTPTHYKIKKLSRVNDMVLDVDLGKDHVKTLVPGDRTKKTLATSEHLGMVRVESSMPTMNGTARVTDVKTLVQEGGEGSADLNKKRSSVYIQRLTIVNESTGKSHETIRYFVPFHGEIGPTALTAGGNKKKERYYDDDHMDTQGS